MSALKPSVRRRRNVGAFDHYADDAKAVTVGGMARLLSIGLSSAWNLVATGQVESFHIGKRCLVPISSVDEFIARRMAGERPLKPPPVPEHKPVVPPTARAKVTRAKAEVAASKKPAATAPAE
jgi:hypothetical protein